MNIPPALFSMDIYLLDQVLRGHVPDEAVILDAGCGGGRNVRYFLESGNEVHGIDTDPERIAGLQAFSKSLGRSNAESLFRVEALEDLSLPADSFGLVICNAVLHFARDEAHFRAMTEALHRVTKPGGICFCRVASTIGIESLVAPLPSPAAPRWHRLPDGSDRFLVDLEFLLDRGEQLGVTLVDPIKTVQVQRLRSMTNWVWTK